MISPSSRHASALRHEQPVSLRQVRGRESVEHVLELDALVIHRAGRPAADPRAPSMPRQPTRRSSACGAGPVAGPVERARCLGHLSLSELPPTGAPFAPPAPCRTGFPAFPLLRGAVTSCRPSACASLPSRSACHRRRARPSLPSAPARRPRAWPVTTPARAPGCRSATRVRLGGADGALACAGFPGLARPASSAGAAHVPAGIRGAGRAR